MSGTKRYDVGDKTAIVAKRDIGGNWYLVVVYPHRDDSGKTVSVHADTTNGDELPFPEALHGTMIGGDVVASREIQPNDKESVVVSKAVNEAARKLSRELEEHKSTEDAVISALDANEQIHGE